MGKSTVIGIFSAALLGLALAGPAPQAPPQRGSSHLFGQGVSLNNGEEKWSRAMLPLTVIPSYYNVSIRPILYTDVTGSEWTAPGHVDITFEVASNATNFLVLHRHPTMTINEATIAVSHTLFYLTLVRFISLEILGPGQKLKWYREYHSDIL